MKDIETPEEMLYKFFNKETEFWKNFANEELNDLKTAREKMQKIYNIKKQEIEAEEQFNEALKKFNDGLAKADETIKMLDEKYPYLKDTLPVKCETKSNTPFKDELTKYMEEYIQNIKNLRKKIKTIWDKK